MLAAPDVSELPTLAHAALETVASLCDAMADHLARTSLTADGKRLDERRLDERQTDVYNLAVWLSRIQAARSMAAYAARINARLAGLQYAAFVAELVSDIAADVLFRADGWGLDPARVHAALLNPATRSLVATALDAATWEKHGALVIADGGGPIGLDSEHEMIRQQFRKFAERSVVPEAQRVHRNDDLIPASIIAAVAELGCFGLSIPEQYGGLQPDDAPDNLGMCVVTEELSRASLGVAGSLITRPEILSKALLKGGTEAQKQQWLPRLAAGETLCAVAVTEPDFGSDVAGLKVVATPTEGGWLINGQKTWCTFGGLSDVLMVLARSNPDPASGHKGLTIFLAEKPRFDGHDFDYAQPSGGRITGRAIDTIGYRGMHSFDVFFEDYFVPDANVVGGETGIGRGFYFQMEGFAGGRLQTAARATGVMQAALDAALRYTNERKVFGKPVAAYQLSRWKLARMAMLTQVSRQFTYDVAAMLDRHEGQIEASMVKLWASRVAEWVTREAMQLHGGMGYAEEYDVSRYFVDARVFSIFEGAEEVLALKVVARQILQQRLERGI